MAREGPGDYIVAGPTFPLLDKKAMPELDRLFRGTLRAGRFVGRDRHFELNSYGSLLLWDKVEDTPTKIFFGHADDPESLESATAKAAWLDEAGQKKFRLESFEAVKGRLSIHQGRCLITTTPYSLNYWIKRELWDKCDRQANKVYGDTVVRGKISPLGDIEVIQFESVMNPTFSREEFEKHRRELPEWKFNLFYRAEFTRPAGVIYESWNEELHKVPPFAIPDDWPRYIGLDFGGVHTAAVFLAEEVFNGKPTGRFFVYKEYPERKNWKSGTAKDHVANILVGEPRLPKAFGGASSEDQWRAEFAAGGLPVREPPIKDVESGIDRVHAAMKQDRLFVFDSCAGLLDDIGCYSRELDEAGNPTEKIEAKETFHLVDALRYIGSFLFGTRKEFWVR